MAALTNCSDFGAPKIKFVIISTVSLSICHEVMGLDIKILVFLKLSFKPSFSLSSFTFIKRLFSSSSLSAVRVASSAYLRLLIFLLAILIPAWTSKFFKRWEYQTSLSASEKSYAGQEATVRIGQGRTDWFQIGKEVCQGCILSPCLFNLYAEYIMRNAGLDKAQTGIKIAGRNINNLRYADHTTLTAESEEEL